MRDGRAIGATDFKLRADGLTRVLVVDRGLYPHEVGALVQRLIELETYRTLALLGLPRRGTCSRPSPGSRWRSRTQSRR